MKYQKHKIIAQEEKVRALRSGWRIAAPGNVSVGKTLRRMLAMRPYRLEGRSATPTGFTLVELLTAIAVAAIGLVVAVPSFEVAINSWRLTAAANETLAAWHAARMEAIRANHMAIACSSSDPHSESPTCSNESVSGWIAFIDNDKNRQYSTGDKLVRTVAFTSNIVLKGETVPLLAFHPDGRAWADEVGGELTNLQTEVCIRGSSAASRELIIESGSSMFVQKREMPGCAKW